MNLAMPADEHRDLVIDLAKALSRKREVVLGRSDQGETEALSSQRPEAIVDRGVVRQHPGEENAARRDHHDRSQDELNRSPRGLNVHW